MKIRYTNSLEHLAAFNRFHLHRSPAMKWQRWGSQLVVGVLVFIAGIRIGHVSFALVFIGVLLVMNLLNHLFGSRFMTKRLLAEGKNRGILCEHVLEITPDVLVETTPVSELRSKWISIERIEVTTDCTFVYMTALSAHVIPRRAIVEGDYEAFVSALRESVARSSHS